MRAGMVEIITDGESCRTHARNGNGHASCLLGIIETDTTSRAKLLARHSELPTCTH